MQTNKQTNKKKNGGGLGTRLGSPHMETANNRKLNKTWEQGYLNDQHGLRQILAVAW